jgi:hypothetical protein
LRKSHATQKINRASLTQHFHCHRPNKKFRETDVKQNNQPRELNKGFPLTPHNRKTAKAQWGAPKAQLRHKSCASRTQNKKNQSREHNKKSIPFLDYHRANKKLWKPTKNPRKPNYH